MNHGLRVIALPAPRPRGPLSLEEAIAGRRSRRSYSPEPLTLWEAAQLLWAAQGVTEPHEGLRAAPSAGATYPLELYLAAGRVEDLEPGVYHYISGAHALRGPRPRGDPRPGLYKACLEQPWVLEAPASIVIAAVPGRTTSVYGKRGMRYVYMEAGHASQNIYLQAEALGLATVAVAAFHDEHVARLLQLPGNTVPLYVMPVGHRPR